MQVCSLLRPAAPARRAAARGTARMRRGVACVRWGCRIAPLPAGPLRLCSQQRRACLAGTPAAVVRPRTCTRTTARSTGTGRMLLLAAARERAAEACYAASAGTGTVRPCAETVAGHRASTNARNGNVRLPPTYLHCCCGCGGRGQIGDGRGVAWQW